MKPLDFALGNDESQAQRWLNKLANSPRRLPAWRTPARQRLLISAYFSALALGIITAVGCFFWTPLVFLWIPVTVMTTASWCMLRATIDGKDLAPAAALDEYENQVLHSWRSLAYGCAVFLLFLLGTALIFLSIMRPSNPFAWVYSLGPLTLVGNLAVISLPVVGYAQTFNTDKE